MVMTHIKTGFGVTDTVGDIKTAVAIPTASHYMTFESPVGVDYSVTAGKTFIITRIMISSATASVGAYIGYGDDGVADGAAAPTNWKQMSKLFFAVTAATEYTFDVCIPIPAGKYPCALSEATAATRFIQIFGIEV